MRQAKYYIFLIVLFCGFFYGCFDDPKVEPGIQNAKIPQLGTTVKIERTASSITLTASVEKANGAAVEERGLCWSKKNNPTVRPDSAKSFGKGLGEFSGTIENLSNNTAYYIRPYAKNLKGIAYGEESKVSTNTGLGSVRTFVIIDSVRAKTALSGGKIELHGEGTVFARGVYYSTSSLMLPKDSVLSTMDTDSFICRISGLRASTKYYVQAFVRNRFGYYVVSGPLRTFVTGDGLPTVSPVTILKRGYTTATFSAIVVKEGDAPVIQRGFCWSTKKNPTIENATYDDKCGVGSGTFKVECENLISRQKYYVRAFARNKEFGISYSEQDSFITKSNIPTVTTAELKNILKGAVTVGGKVEESGQSAVKACGICWSATATNPTLTNAEVLEIEPNAEGVFSSQIAGLKGGATYYFRAYATNNEGTSYGEIKMKTMPHVFKGNLKTFQGAPRIQNSPAYFSIRDWGYILGGDIGPQYTAELHYYNATTDEWRAMLPHPEGPVKWQTAVVHDRSAFIFGGMAADRKARNDFYQYNSWSNTWYDRSTAIRPDSSYLSVGFALNDSICYVGGRKDTVKNEVWMYEISANTWKRQPDFPVQQYGGIAVTIGNTAYVGLGKNGSGVFNKGLWKTTNAALWTRETICTIPTEGILAGVAHHNRIYMIDEAYYIIEYNPSTMTWTKKSQLPPQARGIHCMFVMNDLIYIGLSPTSTTMISYDPTWDN
ncbi:MAG: Kelch repeat-containing protein [Tannerella sp.]|uniref:Kelch repeat-containing protein n=1 Tax=Tannerella sp. TaxID=2382127 RepID=UPI003FA2524A